jgi:hypothetical protein
MTKNKNLTPETISCTHRLSVAAVLALENISEKLSEEINSKISLSKTLELLIFHGKDKNIQEILNKK